jgi:hypothetical protein
VVHVARDREPERPRFQGLAHQALHRLKLGRRGVAIGALLAHGIEPDGRVADQRAHVHPEIPPDGAHVLGEALPRPRHAGLEDVHGNGLDVRQHARQLAARLGLDRGEGQGAVADDDRGRAVMAGVGAQRIPGDLRVVVAVVVDEARRDGPPIGLDDLPRDAAQAPQLHDLAPRHGDVAVEGGPTGAVDDASIPDEQVVTHAVAPPL